MSWYSDKIKPSKLFHSPGRIGRDGMSLLYPGFALKVFDLVELIKKEKLPFDLFETYRSQERQLNLFKIGSSQISKNGMHHFGVAVDIVGLDKNMNWTWGFPAPLWKQLGALGKSLGLYWGGDWKSIVDCPHFQLVPATVQEQAKIVKGIYPK